MPRGFVCCVVHVNGPPVIAPKLTATTTPPPPDGTDTPGAGYACNTLDTPENTSTDPSTAGGGDARSDDVRTFDHTPAAGTPDNGTNAYETPANPHPGNAISDTVEARNGDDTNTPTCPGDDPAGHDFTTVNGD